VQNKELQKRKIEEEMIAQVILRVISENNFINMIFILLIAFLLFFMLK
jgi:hypothetical protein